MLLRLLEFLRCAECGEQLRVEVLAAEGLEAEDEITEAFLLCEGEHWFPVVRGVPRMYPGAQRDWWSALSGLSAESESPAVRELTRSLPAQGEQSQADQTQTHFSLEWDHHEPGDRTWGLDLDFRVQRYFVETLRIAPAELPGKVVLDAGCGNGSQSVAYTELGVEVIAIDLSSGVEHGHAYRHMRPGARPDRVHFIQGDFQTPMIAPGSVDIVHSHGVLHHTPDTRRAFDRLCPALREGGSFYVWLYQYERGITPVVNTIRKVTTRIEPRRFARLANAGAKIVRQLARITNALNIRVDANQAVSGPRAILRHWVTVARGFPRLSDDEVALAIMDIFGPPYAHYHTFDEVAEWFRVQGFDEVWPDYDHRSRGFGACGRLSPAERCRTNGQRAHAEL